MGDIADAMIDGTFCSECGDYLGEGPGHTRICAGCKEDRKQDKNDRLNRSAAQFVEARDLARAAGLTLTAHNAHQQYNLERPGGWMIQFYPSNFRLYTPPARRGPYLRLGFEPDLLKVVRAAIAAEAKP